MSHTSGTTSLTAYFDSIDKVDVRKQNGEDIVGAEEKIYRQRAKDFLQKAYNEGALNTESFKQLLENISSMLKEINENEWATNKKMESMKEKIISLQKANVALNNTNKGIKPEVGSTPINVSAGAISFSNANLSNSANVSLVGLDGGNVTGKVGIQNTSKDKTKSWAAEGTLGKETSLKLALGGQLPFSKETIMIVAVGATNEKISHDFSTGTQSFNAKQLAGRIALVRVQKSGILKRIQAYLGGSHSGSLDLGTDVRIIETASAFDVSDVQKRYAGADVMEFGVGATVDVGKTGELSFGIGQRNVRYDTKFVVAGNTNEMTGFCEYTIYSQSGNHRYRLRYDTSASMNTLTGRADFSIDKKHGTTAFLGVVYPLTGTGSTRIEAGVAFPLDVHNIPNLKQPSFVRPGRTPAEGNVAAVTRSAIDSLPTSVIGKAEERTTNIAKIDKAELDPAAALDRTTGDLLIEVEGATSIASIAPASAAFILEGTRLRVVARSLAVPATGSTQYYVVAINTSGGLRTIGIRVSNLNGYLRIEQVSTSLTSDTTPDAFSFVDQTGVARSAAIISAPITVAGINAASPISIVGGEYSTDGGATWTTAAGTVESVKNFVLLSCNLNLLTEDGI